jgi:Bor protein
MAGAVWWDSCRAMLSRRARVRPEEETLEMKRTLSLMTLSAIFLAGGCFSTTYVAKSAVASPTKVEQKMNFFFWGLSGTGEVNVPEACSGRSAAKINTQHTFVNGLLGIITLGIYVPRTAFITCSQ